LSSDQLKPPGEGNWVEYVDERRKLLLYGGPVTHPLGTLAAEGWEDFELLSTSRALSDASGLGEGDGRTHLVPAGSVPRILLWDTGSPYHYIRLHSLWHRPSHELLLVGGAPIVEHEQLVHADIIDLARRSGAASAALRARAGY